MLSVLFVSIREEGRMRNKKKTRGRKLEKKAVTQRRELQKENEREKLYT